MIRTRTTGTERPRDDSREVLLLIHPFFQERAPWAEVTESYLEYRANLETRLRTFQGRLVTLEETHNIPATLHLYGLMGLGESGKVFPTRQCDPTPEEPHTWRDVTTYLQKMGTTVLVGGGFYRQIPNRRTKIPVLRGCCGETVVQLRGADIPHIVVPGLTF